MRQDDASDAREVRKAEQIRRRERERLKEAFNALTSTEDGLRVLEYGVWALARVDEGTTLGDMMPYREGQRSVGIMLLDTMLNIAPEAWKRLNDWHTRRIADESARTSRRSEAADAEDSARDADTE